MNRYQWQINNETALEYATNTSFNVNVDSLLSIEFKKYIDNGGQVDAIIEPDPLLQNIFTKLQIRRAMRVLGNESILNALLENETFAADWYDAQEIDLNDELTKQALLSVNVDIDAIKRQILGI